MGFCFFEGSSVFLNFNVFRQTLIHPFFPWVGSSVLSAASLKGFQEKRHKKVANNVALWEHTRAGRCLLVAFLPFFLSLKHIFLLEERA